MGLEPTLLGSGLDIEGPAVISSYFFSSSKHRCSVSIIILVIMLRHEKYNSN